MEHGLAVVAVHARGEALDQQEAGRVLQQRRPHARRQLLQEERPQLAPDVEVKLILAPQPPAVSWFDNLTYDLWSAKVRLR